MEPKGVYGYNDARLVPLVNKKWTAVRFIVLLLVLAVIITFWLGLNYKLLFGSNWLSATYDNEDWRTNEGNLHTYGAWDLEAHVWKSEYIMKYFPNFHWNPYWYLGMPLLKYYQSGFYILHISLTLLTGLNAARSATLLIIFSHLLATLMTFLICYKVSRRLWVAGLCSIFLLANTFISLRSYGWEPITVVFLFLYPLGLLFFLRDPLKPLRLSLILTLGVSYLCHPLLFFSLCMTFGIYLFSIAIRHAAYDEHPYGHYIWKYFALVFISLLIGAVQFFPQVTYSQATSGAHMGVSYLPFYHVRPNVIALQDFFFDAGNLKGPGPIIMIAGLLLLVFAYHEYRHRKKPLGPTVYNHQIAAGFALVLFMMVLFYYLELFDLFPMNILRSIQYHRIIPEFIIAAAVVIAALSNIAHSYRHKIFYYTMLIAFVLVSTIIIYNVQSHWQTTEDISQNQEFIYENVSGRITFPYTDQSLAVRNSFTEIPQTYGYYEQGITSAYNDDIFSVSSGFHDADITILYLEAANVGRLYVNMEEGDRDKIVRTVMDGVLPLIYDNVSRYAYYEIPLTNPSFVQAVSPSKAAQVQELQLGCRVLFQETYCGSRGEEFVSNDKEEIHYIRAYLDLLTSPEEGMAVMTMNNPDHYTIRVKSDSPSSVVVKMNYDSDFTATINGQRVEIEKIGPDFMLIKSDRVGEYTIELEYHVSKIILAGLVVSVLSTLSLIVIFTVLKLKKKKETRYYVKRGDMG